MVKRRRSTNQAKNRSFAPLIFLIVLLLLLLLGISYFRGISAVLSKNRVTIVSYGELTTVYSLGIAVDGNYVLPFYPDLRIDVPGGYGQYRVGALGKLVWLEKKPEIFKKTFSLATSSFIDYYFYAPSQQVFFGTGSPGDVVYPTVTDILFNKSNASMGERLAIAYLFLKNSPQQFTILNVPETTQNDDHFLSADAFNQQYQGYFYRKTYRDEKKEVQILYTDNYGSAQRISKILQGNGIRVSDVSQSADKQERCLIKEHSTSFSQTAVAISKFLGCELTHGDTDIYDILILLSNKEKEWQ